MPAAEKDVEDQQRQPEVVVVGGADKTFERRNSLQLRRCEVGNPYLAQVLLTALVNLVGVAVDQDDLALGADEGVALVYITQNMTMLMD